MSSKKCLSDGCKNKPVKQRRYCHKCRSRKYRSNYPIKYAYDTIKTNAKRRGRPFTITLEYFKELIAGTNYLHEKGRTRLALQIDRIDNELGYVPGNLRIVTQEENVKAYQEFLKTLNQRIPSDWEEYSDIILNEDWPDGCPF